MNIQHMLPWQLAPLTCFGVEEVEHGEAGDYVIEIQQKYFAI